MVASFPQCSCDHMVTARSHATAPNPGSPGWAPLPAQKRPLALFYALEPLCIRSWKDVTTLYSHLTVREARSLIETYQLVFDLES